jgi:hypothetical protein
MNHPRPTRRAYALIEVVLAISSIAIVLGLCTGLLHVLLRLDRTARDHLVETATIDRLARQFRQDVHAAREARAGADEAGRAANLDLTLAPDHTIVYDARERLLARTEHHGATVARRETYALPFCREGRFLVRNTDGQVWVSLALRRGTAGPNDVSPRDLRHDLQFEALAGRSHSRAPMKTTHTSTERQP